MNDLHVLTSFLPPVAQFCALESSYPEPECLTPVLSSNAVRRGRGTLATLLRRKMLYPVFQPIASLEDGSIYAHEALIRGPEGSPLHTPDKLLQAAEFESLNFEFENQCVLTAMARWGSLREAGRLFLNISADALIQALAQCEFEGLMAVANTLGISPRMLVLEITEYERVADMDQLALAVRQIRAAGVSLALDDFGDGRSSLRLWSQIKPEFVKIDKYFTKDISQFADKLKTIQALQQIAAIFGTALIAEGIETEEDLHVLRDMGIPYGQGYLLGRPAHLPRFQIEPKARVTLRDRSIAVFPEMRRTASVGSISRLAVIKAPTVSPTATNDELARVFFSHPKLHAIAVVDEVRPVGIINRTTFMNEYSKLYYREIWGQKSCMSHANLEPRVIERNHSVDDLVGILTSDDQRYLVDGFIVTDNGRYEGMGTGEQLVRSVTETRIEAARHANPLTFLPGNIPISQHIERLLASGVPFVACYADLNNFKPFNDQYGYWRGDEMIRLLASLCQAHCDPRRDFVGHVGGDDFILLYQSDNWQMQCEAIIAEFAQQARALFDETARAAGGIQAEDRHGVPRFFPLTTLSIGAVIIHHDEFTNAEQVASVAARAKHDAKTSEKGLQIRVNKGMLLASL
ncbi:phosphodiesterase [Rhodoferax sp. BLA1]|uniref:GGDEF domain-containing protein n=1 Tax=Rhodoferax sp. BLA1 TaxID=2576062 RepID=UPI0015D28EB1|nr:phosphodiesterase [Rhodoferax sp. BLA1]